MQGFLGRCENASTWPQDRPDSPGGAGRLLAPLRWWQVCGEKDSGVILLANGKRRLPVNTSSSAGNLRLLLAPAFVSPNEKLVSESPCIKKSWEIRDYVGEKRESSFSASRTSPLIEILRKSNALAGLS